MKNSFKKFKEYNSKHPYFKFWALITVAFIIIVIISFLGGIDFGFYNMKGSSFKDDLTKEKQTEQTVAEGANLAEVETPKLAEPDTTVKQVFLFGDSMTSLLALRIADYGAKNGYKVTSLTWDGASTIGYSKDEKLINNLASVKPDFIFISLGGNEIQVADVKARSVYVKKLLELLGDTPFVWVGPTIEGKDNKFEEMITSLIPEGSYFVSPKDVELGPDKIHPTRKGAAVLIDSLMRWMPKSHHPILSEKPDSAMKGDWTHIYYNARNQRVN